MIGGCGVLVICLLGVGISGTVERTRTTSNALIALACIWVVAYASFVSPLGEFVEEPGMSKKSWIVRL
jgi:hypothetical protein